MAEHPAHWHNWHKWNLTEETLYKLDRAMPYWLQFPPDQFMCHLADDLGREIQAIDNLVAFMLGDVDAASLTLDDLSRKMTVQEIGDLILRHTRKAQAMLNIACHYAALNLSDIP